MLQKQQQLGLAKGQPHRARVGSSLVVRAEPPSNPRVTSGRTFSDDGKPIAPSSTPLNTSQQQGPAPGQPLYADAAQPKKKEDNMSPEMKKRLREEYVGLGGTPNKLLGARRRHIVFAATVEDREEAPSTSALQGSGSSSEAVQKKGRSKFVIDENEIMKSLPEHRFFTFGSMALMGATLAEAMYQADGLGDWAGVGASVFMAYILSDLGTGIYHWGVDNYGDGNTPVFGRQIAAFQGHHQKPWTIVQREFCNNLYQVFKPASVPAAFFLAISPFMSPAFNAFTSSFLFLVCMSQQFHAWSHMKRSELPGVVLALQEAGILVSRKMHGAHHRAPFEGNYCIVSGLWNPVLDDTRFFRKLEDFFFATTKVEPRCWYPPDADWAEEGSA